MRGMLRWSVHLEGGPRRVNHAAVAMGHKVYSFGGYCSGEDYETLRQIDVHIFNTGRCEYTSVLKEHSCFLFSASCLESMCTFLGFL